MLDYFAEAARFAPEVAGGGPTTSESLGLGGGVSVSTDPSFRVVGYVRDLRYMPVAERAMAAVFTKALGLELDLTARGVEFTQEPMERSYGIDAAFRDPSGNAFRITQRAQ